MEGTLIATVYQEDCMSEYAGKWEQVENGLAEIAAEITALSDMIPALIQYGEDMEPGTPRGIKILLTEIRKRTDGLRQYMGNNFQRVKAGQGGQSLGEPSACER
jgi:hypothetical protein